MPSYTKYAAVALAAALPLCSAQTYTECNPTKTTCPADTGLKSYTFYSDFTQGDSSLDGWNTTAGTVTTGSSGAEFTINKRYDAPTIETNFYFFFGVAEVKMKAASGTGIVSSIVLESDDLDEIDWEALGGDTTQIQSNYFGKGNTASYDRAVWQTVSSPQTTWHTYTVNWTPSSITWSIDGTAVRTLQYNDANGGANFPQTPMRLKLGIWAGGDPSNSQGTIEWAGGETNYNDVPYTMYVESVKITNYNPASSYTWSDQTGSYTSIKASNSTTTRSTIDNTSSDSNASSTSSNSSSPVSAEAASSSAAVKYKSDAASAGLYMGPLMILALFTGLLHF